MQQPFRRLDDGVLICQKMPVVDQGLSGSNVDKNWLTGHATLYQNAICHMIGLLCLATGLSSVSEVRKVIAPSSAIIPKYSINS
ncbi:MAG: hypothetical protein H6R13_577 [Proteobacteria bacterium]|nr:hypothetical protein [Pseudomonadota bacterium]